MLAYRQYYYAGLR